MIFSPRNTNFTIFQLSRRGEVHREAGRNPTIGSTNLLRQPTASPERTKPQTSPQRIKFGVGWVVIFSVLCKIQVFPSCIRMKLKPIRYKVGDLSDLKQKTLHRFLARTPSRNTEDPSECCICKYISFCLSQYTDQTHLAQLIFNYPHKRDQLPQNRQRARWMAQCSFVQQKQFRTRKQAALLLILELLHMALSSLFPKEIAPTQSKSTGIQHGILVLSLIPGCLFLIQKNYLFLGFKKITLRVFKGLLKPGAVFLHEVTKGRASGELIQYQT